MKSESKTTVGRREFLRAIGAGAGVAATSAAPLATAAKADNESNDDKRKVALPGNGPREDVLPGQPVSDEVKEGRSC